jgi:Lipase (class 3)
MNESESNPVDGSPETAMDLAVITFRPRSDQTLLIDWRSALNNHNILPCHRIGCSMPAPLLIPPAAALYAGAAAARTLSYATIGAWLLRYIWNKKVPAWAKEDVSFQNLLRKKKKNDEANKATAAAAADSELPVSELEEREMANLSSILEKLQALVQSVQLDDDHPSMLQQYAAFVAYVQLCGQIKKEEQKLKSDNENSLLGKTGQETEEKKDGEAMEKGETVWKSRDDLFESPRTSTASHPHIHPQYHEFAQNPSESPLRAMLQEALQFATWAYYDDPETLSDKLIQEDFHLLEHSLAPSRPGHVAYYLAVSSASKNQLIVGIRGTSSLEDIVTDCCGRSVPLDDSPYYYELDRGTKRNRASNDFFLDLSCVEVTVAEPPTILVEEQLQQQQQEHQQTPSTEGIEVIRGSAEHIWVERHKVNLTKSARSSNAHDATMAPHESLLHCHEGIMVSAKRLVDTIQEQVEHWVLHRGYQLVLLGHSLGAGVASLAAVLLRSRLPELTVPAKVPKMRVFCFAPPPVLDQNAALQASTYCTSVVNNADLIPRCSIENLLILLDVLKGIWNALQEQELAPTGPKTTAAFVGKIAKGTEGNLILTAPEVRKLMLESMCRIQRGNASPQQASGGEDRVNSSAVGESTTTTPSVGTLNQSLYVPGVVLLGHESWRQGFSSEEKSEYPFCSQPREEYEKSEHRAPIMNYSGALPTRACMATDGKAHALRFLDLDASSRMFIDHTTKSYYRLLDMEYVF